MFDGCTYLEYVDLSMFDTPVLNTATYMFSRCKHLKCVDVRLLDFRVVSSVSDMFYDSVLESIVLGDNFRFCNGTGYRFLLPSA